MARVAGACCQQPGAAAGDFAGVSPDGGKCTFEASFGRDDLGSEVSHRLFILMGSVRLMGSDCVPEAAQTSPPVHTYAALHPMSGGAKRLAEGAFCVKCALPKT